MTELADTFMKFAQPVSASGLDGHAAVISDAILPIIRKAAATTERSVQTAIGPSEVGHPCLRRLAYQTLGITKVNTETDPLPSIIGQGTHSWLSKHIVRCGNGRFLADLRVVVSGIIEGELDLLDTWTKTVVDFKVPGPTAMRKYRAERPGEQYEIQPHLYGLGLHRLGYTPAHVAVMFLPRCGRLDLTHVWSEPWSLKRAEDALNRHADLVAYLGLADAETKPGLVLANIPKTPTFCGYCPWAKAGSTDLAGGCPGDLKAPKTPAA